MPWGEYKYKGHSYYFKKYRNAARDWDRMFGGHRRRRRTKKSSCCLGVLAMFALPVMLIVTALFVFIF